MRLRPVGEVFDQPDFLNAARVLPRNRAACAAPPPLDACKAVEADLAACWRAAHGRGRSTSSALLGDVELEPGASAAAPPR